MRPLARIPSGSVLPTLAAICLSVAAAQADDSSVETPQHLFFDEVTVSEISVVLRVVDRRGNAITGLGLDDLDLRVGGEPVPARRLTWHGSDRSGEVATDEISSGLTLPTSEPESAGLRPSDLAGEPNLGEDGGEVSEPKLIVLFVQIGHHQVVTFDESWITGHMALLPDMERLLESRPPGDLVAVVSYDARLKLWQDFSRDREATAQVLYDAIGFGEPALDLGTISERESVRPSLVETWDEDAARNTTSPEEALWVVGQALEPYRGPKEILFLGWGLGRITGGMVTMPAVYTDALASLQRAQATVHVLNVVQAGGNALSSGLRNVAEATGGTYAATYDFRNRKVERLGRVLEGYYLLVLDQDDFPDAFGKLSVELRKGAVADGSKRLRRGDVRLFYRPMLVRPRD